MTAAADHPINLVGVPLTKSPMSFRLLASLMAQAEGRGVDLITMRAFVEESSQAGARRALASLGLDDERATRYGRAEGTLVGVARR